MPNNHTEPQESGYKLDITGLLKRDGLYIVLLLFALLACAYTIYNIGAYQEKCNNYWLDQLATGNCKCQSYAEFNESFTLPLLNLSFEVS